MRRKAGRVDSGAQTDHRDSRQVRPSDSGKGPCLTAGLFFWAKRIILNGRNHPPWLYCAVMCRLFVLLWAAISLSAQDLNSRFDQIAKTRADGRQFMGNVLIARGDRVVFENSYGSANLEWKVAHTAESKLRIGSVTKQFTAASILLLEDRGKLKTDDPVSKYVPNTPAAWNNITIYNLLTHTAGLPNLTSFPEFEQFQKQPTTPEKLIAFFRDKPLEFEPGSKWKYSNSGYEVLGYVIEKVSGQTYQEFLDENIFKRLHMTDSGYESNSRVTPQHAYGYAPGPQGATVAGYVDMTVPYSTGGLYSTADSNDGPTQVPVVCRIADIILPEGC
jgi:CubicO group peptidase (beta-lactamase class C family)